MMFPENNVRKRGMIFFHFKCTKGAAILNQKWVEKKRNKKTSSLIFLLIYVAISYLNNDLATI